jgi:hypothetical protein
MLHLKRARIDLLVSLAEPLRVELRDGPFQLYEQLDCRVELEVPAPREAVRRGDIEQLDALLEGLLEALASRVGVDGSPLWNRRRVEPLPADHEERLAAYLVWKEEQLYLATRDRLAEALDRAASIVERVDRSASYAQGVMEGVRASRRDRFASTSCEELPGVRFSASYHSAPEELDDRDARDWKDGFEDGQQLRFETALARRLERCLP